MKTRSRLLAMTLLAAGAASLGSCNIVGPAMYFIGGPSKAKAQYILPKDKPAVVFLDDRGNVMPTRSARQRAAQSAERTLLDGKAVGKADIIGSDAVLSIATQERFGKPSGIAEIGRAVGAETVVYATVDTFGLSPDGQEFAPFATARVKVIDSSSRKRLWPGADQEWTKVNVLIPSKPASAPKDSSSRAKAEAELAEQLGVSIGRLFIDYIPEDVAQRVGE